MTPVYPGARPVARSYRFLPQSTQTSPGNILCSRISPTFALAAALGVSTHLLTSFDKAFSLDFLNHATAFALDTVPAEANIFLVVVVVDPAVLACMPLHHSQVFSCVSRFAVGSVHGREKVSNLSRTPHQPLSNFLVIGVLGVELQNVLSCGVQSLTMITVLMESGHGSLAIVSH